MEEVKKQKRKYVSRKEEFYGYTNIEQLLEIIKDVSKELKVVMEAQKSSPTPENEARRKDLNNRRIRVYARMRALGYSAQAMRSKAGNKPNEAKDKSDNMPKPEETKDKSDNMPKLEEVKTEAPAENTEPPTVAS